MLFIQALITGTNPAIGNAALSATTSTNSATTTVNTATTTTTKIPATTTTTAPTTSTLPISPATTTLVSDCFLSFNFNLVGGDLFQTFATDKSDCCNKCGAFSPCVGFVFQNSTLICSLKNINPVSPPIGFTSFANTDFTSGLVTVRGG